MLPLFIEKADDMINLNDPLMKALKAVNSISAKSMTESGLKRHRATMERAGRIAAPKSDITVIPFNVDEIPCEMIRPEYAFNNRYVILYAHGGGYVCGSLPYARILAAKLALATGFSTVSFEYRLAPEYPYPAALDDGMRIWEYLTGCGYAPDHVLFAGESAGGNLVLCMVQKLLAEGRPIPSHLLLFSPWTDLTASSGTYKTKKDKDPILTKEHVIDAANVYIAGAGQPEDPRFSPLFGSFDGFPPTLIMAGRNGILLDDSVRLCDSINSAGSIATLDIEKNGWHVYQQMPIPIAARAMKRLSAYVTSQIYGEDIWEVTTGTK